ncbi:conserved hypothetical protein [Hahella chejuensis KCTC 2396]|uniref:Silver efflux pump n=2 Tax=Hahella chejuensis TaxID=158327 RepID=Q2S7X8_HAHCH|nr:conserved hypothetical protein [Hahella chejuensis KCTC 2396]
MSGCCIKPPRGCLSAGYFGKLKEPLSEKYFSLSREPVNFSKRARSNQSLSQYWDDEKFSITIFLLKDIVMNQSQKKLTGAALAIAAAGFFGTAALTSTTAVAAEAQVHCWGVNSCAGHNDCKTANNDCKGMGSCQGQGFLSMTADECKAKGGTVK